LVGIISFSITAAAIVGDTLVRIKILPILSITKRLIVLH